MPKEPNLSELAMQCYVKLVDELAEIKGFKKGTFAQAVWPEDTPDVSRARWLHIRTITPNINKPQVLSLVDAHRMAIILEENFTFLMMRAESLAQKTF